MFKFDIYWTVHISCVAPVAVFAKSGLPKQADRRGGAGLFVWTRIGLFVLY